MPEPEQKSFQRQVAYKVKVSDTLNINLQELNISRVNIIATIVYKSEKASSYASAIIDDGTGRISLRSFDNVANEFSKFDVGDLTLIIGRIREFNNERYIMPEILKKLDNFEWMNVRKLELNKIEINKSMTFIDEKKAKIEVSSADVDAYEEIYSIIKRLDNGDGAYIEEVIKNCSNQEVESRMDELLKKGNIFEIRPGKVKVLE